MASVLLALAASGGLEFQEERVEWSQPQVTGDVPEPREGHCAHVVRQSLFIYGGSSSDLHMDLHDMHVLDLANMNWESVDTCADNDATCYVPPKAARIACASSGSEMYVFGGYRGEYMNTVSVFDSESLSWRPTTPLGERPHGRQGATLTRLGDRFVLFGGATDTGAFNDVHLLEEDASAWSRPVVTGAKPLGREGHSAALIGTSATTPKLWIFGGKGKVGGHDQPLSDMHYLDYDAHTDSYAWHVAEAVPGGNATARSFHAAAVLGNRMMLFGGMAALAPRRLLSSTHLFDASSFRWSEPPCTSRPPPPRAGQTISVSGSKVFLFGGCTRSRCLSDLHVMTFK